jgi:hypothetical protein
LTPEDPAIPSSAAAASAADDGVRASGKELGSLAISALADAASLAEAPPLQVELPHEFPASQLCGMPQEILMPLAKLGLLGSFVEREIIEAITASIPLSHEEVVYGKQEWSSRNNLANMDELRRFCHTHGLTLEDATRLATTRLKVERFYLEHFSHKSAERFLKRKDDLGLIIYTEINVADEGVAKEIYLQLMEGETGMDGLTMWLASMQMPTGFCGQIGPVLLANIDPRLQAAFRSSQPGQVCEPIPTGTGWAVVRLEQRIAARLDANIQKMMALELFQIWLNKMVEQQLGQLPPLQSLEEASI